MPANWLSVNHYDFVAPHSMWIISKGLILNNHPEIKIKGLILNYHPKIHINITLAPIFLLLMSREK